MADDVDHGGESPCWAHFAEDLDQHFSPLRVAGSNTILYGDPWAELVDFYRNGLGLRTSMERSWFIEFELHPGAYISVADATRASITRGDGAGMTLSWRVDDAHEVRNALTRHGIDASPIQNRWGSPGFFVFDPAGHRIEFWSDGS